MNNMRIFLFVGTIDALMSIIGYMYYRHYLPHTDLRAYISADGTRHSYQCHSAAGNASFFAQANCLDRRSLDCVLLLYTSAGHHSPHLPSYQ